MYEHFLIIIFYDLSGTSIFISEVNEDEKKKEEKKKLKRETNANVEMFPKTSVPCTSKQSKSKTANPDTFR